MNVKMLKWNTFVFEKENNPFCLEDVETICFNFSFQNSPPTFFSPFFYFSFFFFPLAEIVSSDDPEFAIQILSSKLFDFWHTCCVNLVLLYDPVTQQSKPAAYFLGVGSCSLAQS